MGIRVVMGDPSLCLANPDFSESSAQQLYKNEIRSCTDFNFVNKFTNTRFNFLSGPFEGFVCETWFKAELT